MHGARLDAAAHMMRRLCAAALVLLLLALCSCSAPAAAPGTVTPTDASAAVTPTDTATSPTYPIVHIPDLPLPDEYGMGYMDNDAALYLINRLREANGLEPYTLPPDSVIFAANERLSEVCESFSHTRPNGERFSTIYHSFGVDYLTAAENLAIGQYTAEHVVLSWMNSPEHKAILLSEQCSQAIVLCTFDQSGEPVWLLAAVTLAQ